MKHLVFVFVLLMLATACSSSDDAEVPPSTSPTRSSTSTPVTQAPALTTGASTTTRSPTVATAVTAPADPAGEFDYTSIGTESAVSDTALGRLTWRESGSVPQRWLDLGFPAPTPGPPALPPHIDDDTFLGAIEAAPCCLTTMPVAAGLIGLGTTDWDDDRTVTFPADWDEASAFGLGCEEAAWSGRMDEIWFSADGHEWTQMADDAFAPHALSRCLWLHVAEHDGRWLIVGGAPSDDESPSGDFLAFTSTDLTSWEVLPLDLNQDGMLTEISSVTAAERGWVILGTRTSVDPPRSETGIPLGHRFVEWVGWLSVDGIAFEPIGVTQTFGSPWCEPNEAHSCATLYGHLRSDALVVYAHQYSSNPDERHKNGWRLWIGLFEG